MRCSRRIRQSPVALSGVALCSKSEAAFRGVLIQVTGLHYSSQADEASTSQLVLLPLAEAALDSLQPDETSTGLLVLLLLREATVQCRKADESSASLFKFFSV